MGRKARRKWSTNCTKKTRRARKTRRGNSVDGLNPVGYKSKRLHGHYAMKTGVGLFAAFLLASNLYATTAKQVDQLRQQAEDGNSDAEVKLAMMYEMGQGVPKDFNEALKWYKAAAEKGNAFAQGTL